jgi:hypothetical protein
MAQDANQGSRVIWMSRRNMKVVKLLEPEMCLQCRFAQIADVETETAGKQRMIYCRRLDCDNWDMSSAEHATDVQVQDDAA